MGMRTCLTAADAGSFWVFQKNNAEYKLVLADFGNSLEFLSSYTNGYRNIVVHRATAAEFHSSRYVFSKGRYKFVRHIAKPTVP